MTIYVRRDFHVCPNPLSADSYTLCEWACSYCWIKEAEQTYLKNVVQHGLKPRAIENVQKQLKRAFDSDSQSKDPAVLGLRAKLPVLIGRKCEPFAPVELKHHATETLVKELNRYNVTSIIETKGMWGLPTVAKKYDNVGFLISIIPGPKSLLKRLEPQAPDPEARFAMAKGLKEAGLWVGLTAEPIIPSINSDPKMFVKYAEQAEEAGVDHVNFGGYRIHNPKLAAQRMAEAGFDLIKIMKEKEKAWRAIGFNFFDILQAKNLMVSSPDWDLYYWKNDCFGCCGLDDFGIHKFTFQTAVNQICDKGKVNWDEMSKQNVFGEKFEERFKEIWNGKAGYYNLIDAGFFVIGKDKNGNRIYGKTDRRRKLEEVFA